jgi:S-adenosylmethionine/arginine decarboxylase-like enzyme
VSDSIFGWELLLDLYDCDLDAISSRESIANFAVKVCECLQMRRFGEPFIEHFGHDKLETAGYSLVQLIETSSVVAHFSEHKRTAYLDIFSCKPFDSDQVAQFSQRFFGARRTTKRFIERE